MDEQKTETMVFFGVAALIIMLVVINLNNGMVQDGSLAGMAAKNQIYSSQVSSTGCGVWSGTCMGWCDNGGTCTGSYNSQGNVVDCKCTDFKNLPCGVHGESPVSDCYGTCSSGKRCGNDISGSGRIKCGCF